MNSNESINNYLLAIYSLSLRKPIIKANDIANHLCYSKASVSIALKKMEGSNLLSISSHRIKLTESGFSLGQKLYEQQLLIKSALVNIGVNEETAKQDASEIKFALSDETFIKLKSIFSSVLY